MILHTAMAMWNTGLPSVHVPYGETILKHGQVRFYQNPFKA